MKSNTVKGHRKALWIAGNPDVFRWAVVGVWAVCDIGSKWGLLGHIFEDVANRLKEELFTLHRQEC